MEGSLACGIRQFGPLPTVFWLGDDPLWKPALHRPLVYESRGKLQIQILAAQMTTSVSMHL